MEKGFLLATLKAWMMKPPRRVIELGIACRTPQRGGAVLVKEDTIAACYERLFARAYAIPVLPEPIKFPAGKRQRIRPHALIVEKRATVSSLGAALLLAAVLEAGHQHGVDPDLTPACGSGGGNEQSGSRKDGLYRLAPRRPTVAGCRLEPCQHGRFRR